MSTIYGLAYSKDALAFLKACPAKHRKQVIKKIDALMSDPHPAHRKLVQAMGEDEQVWRVRSGDYRVLYVVRDVSIVILDIDHRKDVYR